MHPHPHLLTDSSAVGFAALNTQQAVDLLHSVNVILISIKNTEITPDIYDMEP